VADRHLRLTLKSTSGSVVEEFNDQNRAQKLLDVAVKKIPLTQTPAQPYVMKLERTGAPLDPNEKLAELGIQDGDTILIQAGTPRDG
jgi:uncharacterized ubiquitin-like protein YukD